MGNKKISIIIPVYNEEGLIERCLAALINQDYPKEDYEIVVVNDGSTDGTLKVIREEQTEARRKKVNLEIINLKINRGWIIARETGAENAKYSNLLFIDSRCIANKSVLKNIKRVDYQPLIANINIDYKQSSLGRFNYLFRKKMYSSYYGPSFKPVLIDKSNFDKVAKGIGAFYCNKKLFLSSRLEDKGKNASNDPKLLWNIVQKRKILKHPDIKVTYLARNSFGETLKHIFQRGPKFVDFQLTKRGGRFWSFILTPIIILIFTIALFFHSSTFFLYWFGILALVWIFISLWLAENIKDFLIVMGFLPIIGLSFELGILKGLFSKLCGRIKPRVF